MTNLLKAIYTIWLREILRFVKSKSRLVGSIAQPFIWLAIVGVGLNAAFKMTNNISYLSFMAIGIMGMTILFNSLFAGINVIWDRQFGFLKEILVAPISRIGIVLGKIFGSTTISVIMALIVLIIVLLFGIISIKSITFLGIITAIIFMILTSVTFVGMGLIIATNVDNIEGFQVLMNFLVMPLFFLSGALFPITSSTPEWLQIVSKIDPLFYAIDGIRGSLTKISVYPVQFDLLIVFIVAVVLVLIADIMFRKIEGK
ncbi:MAG: ABC transporter permease [Candidatus Marsarchaeota archaeon]|nr:ABC transporter permease [Candidatus Marsarchaeota archaeon]MCL5094380.1 ABC transporter permease [Candidatus Marsarchaeota archaeon]